MPRPVTEEAEVDLFDEDLQELLELTPQKRCPFFIRDWNAKVGRQEIPGTIGKFGLGVQNEAGQRLTVLARKHTVCQQRASTLFQQHKMTPHMDITR